MLVANLRHSGAVACLVILRAYDLKQLIKTTTMNSNELKIKGNWNELKGKVKQKYAELTDDDLAYEEGKDDELLGRIQKKLGQTKEQVIDWIQRL